MADLRPSDPSPLPVLVRVRSPEVGVIVLDRDRREVVEQLFGGSVALPHRVVRRFSFAFEGMTATRVELTAGAGTRREEVVVIGVLELFGLPPCSRGAPIELRVERTQTRIDAELVDIETGKSASLSVECVLED